MALELLTGVTVQEGLRQLGLLAYSTGQIMLARVETPILEDETNLWKIFLDLKTISHHGGVNEDDRHRFKVDHDFDLDTIVKASISSEGSMPTTREAYKESLATEFVIVKQSDLKGANADYAIRADKYKSVRQQLGKDEYKAEDLEKDGGFKINMQLRPEEVIRYKCENVDVMTREDIKYVNGGWWEHAVGKSRATEEEYLEAAKLLARYVKKAQEERCFSSGFGMGFFVGTDVRGYEVRHWYINNSSSRSGAVNGSSFGNPGKFLRARDAAANNKPT